MFFQGFHRPVEFTSPAKPKSMAMPAWRSCRNIWRWEKRLGKGGKIWRTCGKIWGKDWNMCSENLKLWVALEILGKSYGKLFEKAKLSWFLHYIRIISLVQNWTSGWLVDLGVKTIWKPMLFSRFEPFPKHIRNIWKTLFHKKNIRSTLNSESLNLLPLPFPSPPKEKVRTIETFPADVLPTLLQALEVALQASWSAISRMASS